MVAAVDVFTPNSIPTHTYVPRDKDNLEQTLRNALAVKNSVISLAGPSKSGKTVLLNKVISKDDLIYLTGASVKSAEDIWRIVLAWMGASIGQQHTTQTSGGISANASAEASAGIIFAKAGARGELGVDAQYSSSRTSSSVHDGLVAVAREIADSSFVIFVDDFHYIPPDVQTEVAQAIKAGVENGIKFCVASVPHRADDVVRSNPELRGRIHAVDTAYWEVDELKKIAVLGFNVLNVDLANAVVDRLAVEAFGSPQLMQALCLHLCWHKNISATLSEHKRIDVSDVDLSDIFEKASAQTNFQSLVESLHAGPRQRGTERKTFSFVEGSQGDVYRSILLALAADPARLSINYDEMQRRVRSCCIGDAPGGGSISGSLEQMDRIAESHGSKALEWLEDVLDVIDPYFLFYLRGSRKLKQLGTAPPLRLVEQSEGDG